MVRRLHQTPVEMLVEQNYGYMIPIVLGMTLALRVPHLGRERKYTIV